MSRTTEYVYGSFSGGDPRKFHPDPDCSTEQEREAHRRACFDFARAEAVGKPLDPLPCPHKWAGAAHINIQPFGLGTQEYEVGNPQP